MSRMPRDLTRLTTKAEILDVTGHDVMLECDLPDDYDGDAFALGGAVSAVRLSTRDRRPGMLLAGAVDDVAPLLVAMVEEGLVATLGPRVVTVPRPVFPIASTLLPLTRGDDWDWMWTRRSPTTLPGEERLDRFTERDRGALDSFLAQHNPRTHGAPYARPGQVWIGLRDSQVSEHDGIVACGSVEPGGGGRPHLAGITVAPAVRGQGLGAAVSAALTRRAIAEQGISTLGLYAVNDTARRLYSRLGYRCDHRLSTRLVGEDAT